MATLKQAISRVASAATSIDKANAILDVLSDGRRELHRYPPLAFMKKELTKIQGRLEGVLAIMEDEEHRGDVMSESGSINERD